tara:strand:- start:20441 stop:20977 length:537 start_codon:yes stop_codon:yes gene_type:complete
MQDNVWSDEEQQWVIWNGFYGLVTLVTLGDIESGPDGRLAWLEEPFEMVGPFNLDELETTGRIAFEECLVLSRQRWQQDQVVLRREGLKKRRQAEERLSSERARFNQRRGGQVSQQQPVDDSLHRQALELPGDGKLKPADIKAAYRKLAQKMHPDAGGSSEQFVRITAARDELLLRAS